MLISILTDLYPVSPLGPPDPPPRPLEERKPVTTVLQDFAYDFNLLVCGDLGGIYTPQYVCKPHMFRCPLYIWTPTYVQMPPYALKPLQAPPL